jgi:hypothetical protein
MQTINFEVIEQAKFYLLDAIENPEPDEGLASAEKALELLNFLLGFSTSISNSTGASNEKTR